MNIVGIENCSLVDYPGVLSAVFFTPGCNFDCFYCHNRSLVRMSPNGTWLGEQVALASLDERRGFLDAAVITGGEPTLQPDLADFIRQVRARDYLVKLDTNGSRPAVLASLLEEGLLDYVAMDVKAPPHRYREIACAAVDVAAVEASMRLLMASGVAYEFRTTVAPLLDIDDICTIARWICGATRYALQQFRRPTTEPAASDPRNAADPHASDWPERAAPLIRPFVDELLFRGFDAAERTRRAPIEAAKLAG